jgi:dipeptidase
MAENHLNLTLGGDGNVFNPREAFGSASDSDHVYNTPRAWAIQRFLNPYSNTWDGPDADYRPEDDDIPWCRVPERKVTIEDIKYALSLHYQGTPYDPYGTKGDEHTRGIYRPIGINRNSQLAVLQLRPYGAKATQPLVWVAFGSNPFNAFVPLFAQVDEAPAYFSHTDGTVSTESFYWACRLVGALADAHYGSCIAHIERYQEAVGSQARAMLLEAERGLLTPEESNARIAAMVRTETDRVLDHVLFEASMGMRNGFARSDN